MNIKKKISIKYNPKEVESKWYSYWINNNYFQSQPNNKKSYTILMPPPNVTGILHMGHILNNTLQDILIRKARMQGFNACWVPGTDHASIATEAKIVKILKEKKISKFKIGRKKFLEYARKWTYEQQFIILEQLKQLGCSCDWNRIKFTLDNDLSKSVTKMFIILYNRGNIYRDNKIINWDPEAKTNISDEEVFYKEQQCKLYFLKYFIENSKNYIVVATTRPETIFGDTAICFHPNDEKYFHLKNKRFIIPIVNRLIPAIYDNSVDRNFGTGILKITPGSDINDYYIAKKHQLPIIEIFNEDGTLNEFGMHYSGKDRFIVRNEIEKEFIKMDLLKKVQNYVNRVGISERTGAIIEPKISMQWFLKMNTIINSDLDGVMKEEIKFFPAHYKSIYKNWIDNIHDWNISRQLWWGHRIPVFYFGKNLNDFVVAETIEDALLLAKQKSNNLSLTVNDLKQDEDVLDTWFSSWIWPISVFDGINNPNNKEINYYYPTQDLVTGSDIIFFWVTRMIIAGYFLKNEKPFCKVYFSGIVKDKSGKKMSKQLGNSPNPTKLILKYGADSIRMGIIMNSPMGNDLKFDERLCLQGRNFCNKLWNAARLIISWTTTTKIKSLLYEEEAITWFEHKLYSSFEEIEIYYSKGRISDALIHIYKLFWYEFCSWYLEIIKPSFGAPISYVTHLKTIEFFENLLKILHPFIPFITEEIWQLLKKRSSQQSLIISDYPKLNKFDKKTLKEFEFIKNFITIIRNYRKNNNLSYKIDLDLYIQNDNLHYINIVKKLINAKNIFFQKKPLIKYTLILVDKLEVLIPVIQKRNTVVNKEKLYKEIEYLKKFLNIVEKKLLCEKFLSNANSSVINLEKKKKYDIEKKLEILINQLNIN